MINNIFDSNLPHPKIRHPRLQRTQPAGNSATVADSQLEKLIGKANTLLAAKKHICDLILNFLNKINKRIVYTTFNNVNTVLVIGDEKDMIMFTDKSKDFMSLLAASLVVKRRVNSVWSSCIFCTNYITIFFYNIPLKY